MIPEAYIIDWKRNAPWRTDAQVEQDLILSRILVELYNDPLILEELLSTKLRALYQRNKGRDLFDIWYGLSHEKVDPAKIIDSFKIYMGHQNLKVSKEEFRKNLELKLQNSDFRNDITALVRPDIPYPIEDAFHTVDDKLISRL